jgi:hypothetical protein
MTPELIISSLTRRFFAKAVKCSEAAADLGGLRGTVNPAIEARRSCSLAVSAIARRCAKEIKVCPARQHCWVCCLRNPG